MEADALAGLDAEYAADAGEFERQTTLQPYFGLEDQNRGAAVAAQRATIAGWLSRNCTLAIVRREIRERRKNALAAEGFA